MAIQSMQLDPNAAAYTDDEIVAKINSATSTITRASCVSSAARPIESGEVTNTELDTGVAKANLDAMSDTERGYVKTNPTTGEYPVINIQRDSDGKLDVDYDNVAV